MGLSGWSFIATRPWQASPITAFCNTLSCLSCATGMGATWTSCTGSRMVQQCIALTETCATLTISLVTTSSVGGLCAEENGPLAHPTYPLLTSFCGGSWSPRYSALAYRKVNWKLTFSVQVYTPRPRNLDELEMNIRREVAALDPQMINRSIMDMRARAHKCIIAGGGNFE